MTVGPRARRANPFPAAPVAGAPGTSGTGIVTGAMRELSSLFAEYAADPSAGAVAVVTGDVGAGKTHVANHVSDEARAALPEAALVRIEAGTDFLDLYDRFLRELGEHGFRAQVDGYYVDAISHVLRDQGYPADLLTGSAEDLKRLVKRMSLSAVTLWQAVQHRVQEATGDQALGEAVRLLVHQGSVEHVWKWLRGAPPGVNLERLNHGTRLVDTDREALSALTGVARMCGGRGRGFMLVVDEADRLFSVAEHHRAFQKMMEDLAGAGAFVLICGGSDFVHRLPEPVRHRIAHLVPLAPLTGTEAHDLVAAIFARAFGTSGVAPFTRSAVTRMHAAAEGNPRHFLRLCHLLFRAVDFEARTADDDISATDAMVDRVLLHPLLIGDTDRVVAREDGHDPLEERLAGIERRLALVLDLLAGGRG
ncbi:AAA family ATPase [Saccharothrix stipae]